MEKKKYECIPQLTIGVKVLVVIILKKDGCSRRSAEE